MDRGSEMTAASLDPRTPVLIGVGQAAERIADPGYAGVSPIDLAVEAARTAIADSQADGAEVTAAIDTIAATRQFENSSARAVAALGRSTKFPLSVAHRLRAAPGRAVLDVGGGQSPQHLVSEFSRAIEAGSSDVVLLVGAEAISTIRHFAGAEHKPDFSDDPAGKIEDRGFGLSGLVTPPLTGHGMGAPSTQYALLENARRAAQGRSRAEYAAAMGELFAPFTEVAANNPFSAAPVRHSAEELVTVTERNRLIADPYPRFVVARDQVNQGAAVLLASVGAAERLRVPQDRWVFLHGQADLVERSLLERAALGQAPSAVAAVRHALEIARLGLADVDFFDLYSCFPIAVFNIIEGVGLSQEDPRGLTLTGGLPFFGGPGNNYSMHAIAEAVARVRSRPGSYALVSANGGMLSKTSVGVYSTTPAPLRPDHSQRLQREIDDREVPVVSERPTGWATIETYTVTYGREGPVGIVIGRLESDGSRFVARAADGDQELLALLQTGDEPVGQRIYVTAANDGNRVGMSRGYPVQHVSRPHFGVGPTQ
jgi:acetyl-CoA C-acetyltransferase